MNRLKEVFDYRVGPQSDVLVPAGTLTHSVDARAIRSSTNSSRTSFFLRTCRLRVHGEATSLSITSILLQRQSVTRT